MTADAPARKIMMMDPLPDPKLLSQQFKSVLAHGTAARFARPASTGCHPRGAKTQQFRRRCGDCRPNGHSTRFGYGIRCGKQIAKKASRPHFAIASGVRTALRMSADASLNRRWCHATGRGLRRAVHPTSAWPRRFGSRSSPSAGRVRHCRSGRPRWQSSRGPRPSTGSGKP